MNKILSSSVIALSLAMASVHLYANDKVVQRDTSKVTHIQEIRNATIKDALMKSRCFTLPKRSITTADEHFNWVIIDATECSIERPKKKSE